MPNVKLADLPALPSPTDGSFFVGAGPGGGKWTGAQVKTFIGATGGGGSGAGLADTSPAALGGAASAGTALTASRSDHVHARPTPTDIGAALASHSHAQTEILGLTAALSGAQATSEKGQPNGYAPLDGTGKVPAANLQTVVGGGGSTTLDALDDVTVSAPAAGQTLRYNGSQFVNVAMTIGDISALQAALDGKAATSHTHAIAGVTGLQAALDAKAASAHAHTVADVTGLAATLTGKQDVSAKGQANGYAGLGSDARVPIAQLPANVVTTDYRSPPELFTGDITVVQTDNNKSKRCIATVDRTVTLPALLVGTTVRFFQSAAGRITFAAGSGVTLQSVGNFTRTSGQNADATVTVLDTNVWHISGSLAA